MIVFKSFFKAFILASASLVLCACFSFGENNEQDPQSNVNSQANKLSKQEQALRDKLIAGRSARPSLQSLDLQPVRIDEIVVPELSLEEKRDEYQALLPLLKDPIQKQQVAFRLADIKMLLAEQAQEEGSDLQSGESAYIAAIADYEQILTNNNIVKPLAGEELSEDQDALNRKQMDAMYQLTRALDLSAKPDDSMQMAKRFLATFTLEQFGLTPYHVELYFRIGEYYFSRQQYPQAVEYYSNVVELGEQDSLQTNFYSISAYMLGWSHFKLDQYNEAMRGFALMLDAQLLSKELYSPQILQSQSIDELKMSKGEQRLVGDAIRVMALTFSYQGNAQAIKAFFTDYGKRDYEQVIYQELAQQYLDDDRFQDSASVLLSFAKLDPLHPKAIEFYIRHIDAFVLGDFPARVLQGKEGFVSTYSLGYGVVEKMDTPIGRTVAPYLQDYIKQLAQTEHSIAQNIDYLLSRRQSKQASNQNGNLNNALDSQSQTGFVRQNTSQAQNTAWARASNEDLLNLSMQAYANARDYYENYIRTFNSSPNVAPMRFYLAEALLALGEYEAAIEAFETYAYIDDLRASATSELSAPAAVEAAYAALLVYQKIANANTTVADATDTRSTSSFNAPLSLRQQSQATFAERFGDDKRAYVVVLTLMQDLFAQENYLPAQQWAGWLLNKKAIQQSQPYLTNNMHESALLVMAHSYFAMDVFDEAENAYRVLLATLATNDSRREGIVDRLAASLYKQAETILVSKQLDTASLQARGVTSKSELSEVQVSNLQKGLALLQSVVQETPLSQFSVAAQYDSAIYQLVLEQWPLAIATFIDFRQRYPKHPLSTGIEDQLFYAYQQTEDWPKLADIMLRKYQQQPNTETGRLALYQGAEYFDKANNRAKALDTYRRYAHQYPMPLADANEARFKLSEFYLASGEDSKRRFWLNKIVQAHKDILANQAELISPRAVYLASMSAMVFAKDADTAYTRIKLTQPLDKSLQRKQQALKKAISEYDTVISFGSAEYVTAANYALANLYTTLADDLMDSSRPEGLSALELSQYEILLEEQAYPFEETAIELHEKNTVRVQSGIYDDWVKASFEALKNKMPGRYNKPELVNEVSLNDF